MQMIYNKRVPIQIHNDTIFCLRKYLSLANIFFDAYFPEPQIKYKKKGSIAGSALLEKWEIQINISMLLVNRHDFINEVIPHELAHLIAHKIFGKIRPHGKEWQYIMNDVFHCIAKRTHSFNLPDVLQQNRYLYYCQCQDHALTRIRHNKIQHGQAQYYCKSCRTLLQPSEND